MAQLAFVVTSTSTFRGFLCCLLGLAVVSLGLTSCTAHDVSPPVTVHADLHGRAMGGEQPITGATVQLYTVNTTTDGGAATPLINQTNTPVTTSDGTGQMNSNANAGNNNNQLAAGFFTITGDFTCPSPHRLVYIVTIGGNPGAGTNNVQEGMAAIGQCGTLTSNTFLDVNEITTVGTVRALSSFTTGYASVGTSSAHASAFNTSINSVSEYVQIANGTAPGPTLPSGYSASDNDLRALANVVQSCVNSNGSTANGSPCGTFFQDAQGTASTVPSDTITALLDIFADPTNNVSTIFGLQSPTPAFAPTNTSAPVDWTLPILQIPGTPSISPNGGSITSVQNITLTDADTDATNKIYYTTDGSTPSATNGILYTGPFTLGPSPSTTLNAIDIDDSRLSSSVASANFTVTAPVAPTVSLSAVSAPHGSTTAISITATGNDNGALVTFGTAGSVGGSFSPTTCTIASGSCSVNYVPSGVLATGNYVNDLNASFAAVVGYLSATASSTLIINTADTFSVLHSFTGLDGQYPYYGSLVQASDGNFYGTTFLGGANGPGEIYKITSAGTVTVLHSFSSVAPDGEAPYAGLVQGTDGNFYGTAQQGGANGNGDVFKMTPGGTYTLLHSFSTSASDGETPAAGLVQGVDGNFYGTTEQGGANGSGTVFSITPSGTFTLLYSFSSAGTTDGKTPLAGLVQGADGNFYGTTNAGGPQAFGTIFKITSTGTYTLLHSFTGTADGAGIYAGLVQGSDGNFYGTAEEGGANSYGTIFKITPTGTFSLLYSFSSTGTTDGRYPLGTLVQGSDGNFYGTAEEGGANNLGTAFEITTGGTLTLLRSFAGTADGEYPFAGLTQGSDGIFYGTTVYGGANGDGAVFTITPSPSLPGPVVLTVPASVVGGTNFTLNYAVANASSATLQQCFATNNGGDTTGWTGVKTGVAATTNASLTAPVTAGAYSYTLTCGGIQSGFATLNVTTPPTAATPTFTPPAGTYNSTQSVTISTTTTGVAIYYTTDGTTPSTSSTLYTGAISVPANETINAVAGGVGFTTSAVGTAVYTIGPRPAPTVSLSSVSAPGGSTTPLTITASSNAIGSVVTFSTTSPVDGSFSSTTCTLTNGSCSVSYVPSGVLAAGTYTNDLNASFTSTGSYTAATATSTLTIGNTPSFAFTLLHSFAGTADGENPAFGNLVQGSDGNFYETTGGGGANNVGAIVKITPTGTVTLLHSFSSASTDGNSPYAGLVQGTDGNFYGTTEEGGANSIGAFFKITPTGTFTLLHSFAGAPSDVSYPAAALVQGTDGNFYGTGQIGGSNGLGGFYKVTPGGTLTLIYSYTTSFNGEGSVAGLVQGVDGNFYGITEEGGTYGFGAIFKITPSGSYTLLYSFSRAGTTDGQYPAGGLVQGSDGNFYGMAYQGGANNDGTIFNITPTGTFTLLHSFAGTADGQYPQDSLVLGSDGNLYGTTQNGGANTYGTVFEITPSNTFTLLHSFSNATTDGEDPYGGLVQGADGSLYGTTYSGGAHGDGTFFKMTASPTLPAAVTLTVPANVTHATSFTLSYAVANATSETLQQCFATNTGGDTTGWTGLKTATSTATNAALTAPSTAGTYSYTLTCGGMESGSATLIVQ